MNEKRVSSYKTLTTIVYSKQDALDTDGSENLLLTEILQKLGENAHDLLIIHHV